MVKNGETMKIRRSKRQAGLDVSPLFGVNAKKSKRDSQVEEDHLPDNFPENEPHVSQEEELHDDIESDECDNPFNGEEEENQECEDEEARVNAGEFDDHTHPTENETPPPQTEGASVRSEEAQTQQPEIKKKTRGPTRMRKVAANPEDKVDVEFTSLGEHVGKGSVTLSSFLGPLVREHVTVLLNDWRHLDDQTRETMWEEIQGRFNVKEEWQKEAIFRQMGCIWRSSKSKLLRQVRSTKSKVQLQKLKPSNIHSVAAWNSWVKNKTSSAFKVQSDKFRQLRMAQISHTTSRKGMTRLADEMRKKSSDPRKVNRSKVWVAGHTHSDGRPVREEYAETIEKVISIDSEMDSNSTDNIREDAVSQVLGKDKPGRLRGMGRGATITKLGFLQARDSHVQKLEARQADLLSQLEELRLVVSDLAGKKTHGQSVSQSEYSDVSTGGIRCQILDWFSDEDIVIGEGEFCSAEATYKIGRIPLGPNAAAVLVKSVTNSEAYVWRPTTTITSLGQAVGMKIAWPHDKVILDELTQSPAAGSEATSSSIGKVHIYDWNVDDELVAEGILCSTDPREMINDIHLGPKAASVKVELVVKHNAFLWRPSAEISVMGDALNENIAWPVDKIRLASVPTREESALKSPQSGSQSTGTTSKVAKQKCILLACDNSGQRVAVGRVSSTDPTEKVHFVPLGPNASKVWVEISKVDDAKVWRPNSEVEFIADAVGTTIAWPSDKLILL